MDNFSNPKVWLRNAKGHLLKGEDSSYRDLRDIPIELLCFDLQQCVEKSMKAVLVKNKIRFNRSHDITYLIDLLINNKINLPEYIKNEAPAMTQYASETRYPGDWEPITDEEYKEAVKIAEKVYSWAEKQIKE
ncbi:MAG: HEPN protein [uncultured bacterium]|nr:MAG: HEPN protein [uncultured bacterium]